MARTRIAVFGASGFLGSALCERLFFDQEYDFLACANSYARCARIARLPIEIRTLDVADRASVDQAVAGCTFVVNCSRGSDTMMIDGLRNLLGASKAAGVKGFVHLSSQAIFGYSPPPESTTETCRPSPGDYHYAQIKVNQDGMVASSGVPFVILCPGNIVGPYSQFIVEVAEKLAKREVFLVDQGRNPTNLIHADNLAHAVLTALRGEQGWNQMYFVNELETTTWAEFYADMQRRLGLEHPLPSIPRETVLAGIAAESTKPNESILKILVSGEFRRALGTIPQIQTLNEFAYNYFNRQPPKLQAWLRAKLERPVRIDKIGGPAVLSQLTRPQVRTVYHSPAKVIEKLGYQPLLSQEERMTSLLEWLRCFGWA